MSKMRIPRGKRIYVTQEALKFHPELSKLPDTLPIEMDHSNFMKGINRTFPEVECTMDEQGIKVIPKDREDNLLSDKNFLGLPKGDEKFHEIARSIREDTRQDPRNENVISKKSSVFKESGLEWRNHRDYPTCRQTPHCMDPVFDEEIHERRYLADKGWDKRRKPKPKRGRDIVEQAVRSMFNK